MNYALPKELLLSIFSYLPAADLLSASAVCKPWWKLAQDPLLWLRLCSITEQNSHKHCTIVRSFRLNGDDETASWFACVDWRLEYRWRGERAVRVKSVTRPTTQSTALERSHIMDMAYDEDARVVMSVSETILSYWKQDVEGYACVKRMDIGRGCSLHSISPFNSALCYRPPYLYCSGGEEVQQRDCETGYLIRQFEPRLASVSVIWAVPSTQIVAIGSGPNMAVIDLRQQDTRSILSYLHDGTVLCFASAGSSYDTLACGGRFKSLSLFDLRSNRLRKSIYTQGNLFSLTEFNRGTVVGVGRLCSRGGASPGIVERYDLRADRLLSSASATDGCFYACSSNAPIHSRLLTASVNGSVMLWDENAVRPVRSVLSSPGNPLTAVSVGNRSVAVAHLYGIDVLDICDDGNVTFPVHLNDEYAEEEMEVEDEQEQAVRQDMEQTLASSIQWGTFVRRHGIPGM